MVAGLPWRTPTIIRWGLARAPRRATKAARRRDDTQRGECRPRPRSNADLREDGIELVEGDLLDVSSLAAAVHLDVPPCHKTRVS